ncbi:MAG TPA: autotransporter outer membrane beta-barrel domain-containing protein, partial [Candidatus Omnitrophota bacterium]|nr:autotransporter outer membrane beta-barrel domain-containing protein [Candidatus Omnitrophota bacterium]
KIEENDPNDAKEVTPKNDIWIQSYGDYVNQGKRGISNGYRANIWGSVVGLDRLFMDGALRLGLAQGFGSSKIRSKDNHGQTSIDSYQTGLYGEYQGLDSPYIFDAALTYGYNDYDNARYINAGALQRTASSDYNGHQFSSYFEAGYKIEKKGFDIIPLLALDYTYLYLPGYAERGADSLNLTVNSQSYDSLQLGLGCRLSKAIETINSIITPELRFRYFYDVINDAQQTIASFAGGGTSFATSGFKPAPSSFNLGARIEFFNKKNITFLLDFDSSLKEDYYETGGSVTVKYSF